MSEPVCPKPAPCPRCTRLIHLLVFYCGAVLVLVVAMLGYVIADVRDSSSDPKPSPSATSPADPSPSTPATSQPPTPTPAPTAEPTDGPCNIFDPECPGTTGGVGDS